MNNQRKGLSALMITLSMTLVLSACGGGNNAASDNNTAANTPAEGSAVKLKVYAQHFDDDTKGPFDYAVAELKKKCRR